MLVTLGPKDLLGNLILISSFRFPIQTETKRKLEWPSRSLDLRETTFGQSSPARIFLCWSKDRTANIVSIVHPTGSPPNGRVRTFANLGPWCITSSIGPSWLLTNLDLPLLCDSFLFLVKGAWMGEKQLGITESCKMSLAKIGVEYLDLYL